MDFLEVSVTGKRMRTPQPEVSGRGARPELLGRLTVRILTRPG